jgi:crotonobetaine/carnitine-CoA ligase
MVMIQVAGRKIPWGTMGDLAEAKADEHGNAIFAEISGQTLTYSELERQSRAVAENLVARGVAKGERVGTLMFNTVEQVLMCFGCARAGAVWVPLNAALRGEDLTYTIRDSGIVLLVTEDECLDQFVQLDPAVKAHVELFVVGDGHAPHRGFAELLKERDGISLPQCAPSDTGAILYTGGTTGLPKGVLLSQFSFILGGLRYRDVFAAQRGERHFSVLPLFHAGALHWALMGPLVSDMSTVIDRRFSANSYFERVRQCRANIIDPFGAVVTLLCQQPPSDLDTKHEVRISVGVVQNLPDGIPEKFEERFRIPMVSVYGLTEAGGNITSNRLPDPVPNSNGRAHGWAEIRIADEDDLPLPEGDVGEILLRPTYPHMFTQGYHNAPEQSLTALRNLWLHTGDLGYLDEGGNLFYLGRKAHWIRRRGENISAYEIEAAMARHPQIEEIVVVGVRSEIGEDDIKAFIIPATGTDIDFVELVSWTAERLAAFKVPRFIEVVDDFPRSATKREIERSKLKAMPNTSAWDREKVLGRMSGQAHG